MRPPTLLQIDGDIRLDSQNWRCGTLSFNHCRDGILLEIYLRVNQHSSFFSCQFSPGELFKIPPRDFGLHRSQLYFTIASGHTSNHIKIRSSGEQLAKLSYLLNDIKDYGQGNEFSRARNYHGTPPYARTYSQKQFAAARRNGYNSRPSPVVKSSSGHRMTPSPNKFRHPRDNYDSYDLEVVGDSPRPNGFTPKSFFKSSDSGRNYDQSRTPFKSLNTNSNHDHSKRPNQLDFDSPKRSKLSCDIFSREGGQQLGGQVFKESPSQKAHNLSNGDSKNSSTESSPYNGFPNIGNSCFMNSVLQSLLQLRCISNDLDSVQQILEQHLPEQSIVRYLLALLACQPEECQLLLGQTLEVISNSSPCFADGQQHDALEFLVELLDVIKEEVKKASTGAVSDPVTNNIEFQLNSSYMCQKCQRIISKKEVLHMLSLNVPNTESGELSSLTDALKMYFEPQEIEMKCEHCSGTSTNCVQGFSTLPRVLVFHLKRYTYVEGTCKIVCPVQVPIHLSLEEFIVDQGVSQVQHKKSLSPSSLIIKNEDFKTSSSHPVSNSVEGTSLLPSSSTSSSCRVLTSTENSTVSEKSTSLLRSPVKLSSIKASPCLASGRKSLHPTNPSVPIVLKGGSDNANIATPMPATGSEVPVEKIDGVMETITEETEEEQIEKVLKLSRESAQSQEDKELIEAMNRSVQEMSCNYMEDYDQPQEEVSIDLSPVKDNSDVENVSGPFSYQLGSVVSHIGHNADTGHYVANVFDEESGRWWHFNDEIVHRKSKHSVLESIKTQGYLFFYVARNFSK